MRCKAEIETFNLVGEKYRARIAKDRLRNLYDI